MYAHPRRQRATAEDIPPELFDLLTDFFTIKVDVSLTTAVDAHVEQYSIVEVDKHALGNIALVCRRWADGLLPGVLRRITLRSQNDVVQLVEMLNNTHSQLKKHLVCIGLQQENPSSPWFHNVVPILEPLLDSEDVDYQLSLEGPGFAGDTTRPIRSVHHNLPQQVPSSFSPFQLLYLTNVHFRCFSDILRLVGELATLRQIVFGRITWDRFPLVMPAVRMRSKLLYAEVADSKEYWPFCLMFMRWHRQGVEDFDGVLMIDPIERGAIQRVFASVFSKYNVPTDCVAELRMTNFKDPITHTTHLTGLMYSHEGPHYRSRNVRTHTKTLFATPYIELLLQHSDTRATAALATTKRSSYAQVTYIEVNMRTANLPFDKGIDRDWHEFDEAASTLPRLRKVAFGVHTPEDLEQFVKKEDELFPRLKAAGKLARGRWHEKSRCWFAKGRDPAKEPEAGRFELWKL